MTEHPLNQKSIRKRLRKSPPYRFARKVRGQVRNYWFRHKEARKRKAYQRAHPNAPPMMHICICGFPRSGTSLFYNMLCSVLPDFAVDDRERPTIETLPNFGNRISKLPNDILAVDQFAKHNVHGKRLIVIVFLRDLRDILTSVHAQIPDQYFIGYDYRLITEGTWPDFKVRTAGPGIQEIADRIDAIETLPDITPIRIRYEDLLHSPSSVQRQLEDVLGWPFTGSLEDTRNVENRTRGMKYEGIHQPVDPKLVKIDESVTTAYEGRWRDPEYRERIAEQFTSHPELFELLKRYGYESDDGWFDEYRNHADRQTSVHMPPNRGVES